MSGKENNKRMPPIGFLHGGDLLAIELVKKYNFKKVY